LPELKKNPDSDKFFKNGLPSVLDTTPVGFCLGKMIHLLDTVDGETSWAVLSKSVLGRPQFIPENDTIVGYLESSLKHVKFKLRPPTHKINAKNRAKNSKLDARQIEKGIVCKTKNKFDIMKIAKDINALPADYNIHNSRIYSLCSLVFLKLLDKEKMEAHNEDPVKYLYGWWDDIPAITLSK
jgi:hypothetical protein